MTSLPDITQALCCAIARREEPTRIKALCLQAAAKMEERTPERAHVIKRAFEWSDQQPAKSLSPLLLQPFPANVSKHWELVRPETRHPWLPDSVREQVARWSEELAQTPALLAAGERVMPLLLVGETGCGKTSTALALANHAPLYRMSLAGAVQSYLGATGQSLTEALRCCHPSAFWLVDEVDVISGRRSSENSAGKDQAHAIGCLLTSLDSLDPGIPLITASNMDVLMDTAVLRRFTIVKWPSWDELMLAERTLFFESHGAEIVEELLEAKSYADAIKLARNLRVNKLLNKT